MKYEGLIQVDKSLVNKKWVEENIEVVDNKVESLSENLSNNYSTTSQMESAISVKQDILTAGDNISINNNVISAVDTIYDDTEIRSLIGQGESSITIITEGLVDETANREAADTELQENIDTVQTNVTNLGNRVGNVEEDVTTLQTGLSTATSRIDTAESDISIAKSDITVLQNTKQAALVSGNNIKTVNSKNILGSGDLDATPDEYIKKAEVDGRKLTLIDQDDESIEFITEGLVNSVNGQIGEVVLGAEDVGALPDTTTIPSKVSDLTNDTGFITNSALSGYATESWVEDKEYATKSSLEGNYSTTAQMNSAINTAVSTKQDIIEDLSDIRSGAEAGSTAVQPDAISDMATNSSVNTKLADYSTTTQMNSAISTAVSGKLDASMKGSNNGVAELGSDGKVPESQLPSYVDDVLEYANKGSFPTTGESGKIYIALDKNMTYRWSGSTYVEVGSSLALGETESTAYAGNKGKANADAISALNTAIAGKQATLTAGTGIKLINNVISYDEEEIASVDFVDGSISDTIFYINQKVDDEHAGRVAGDNLKQDKLTADNKLSTDYISGLSTVATSGSYNDLSNKPTIPDISTKMDKENPTGSGYFSMNAGEGEGDLGNYSFTEGNGSYAYGEGSHAEGCSFASGDYSHAEGFNSNTNGNYSHAEGCSFANEEYSHSEGYYTTATGIASHAEGNQTEAAGDYSHAEGGGGGSVPFTTANGECSHAEGVGTMSNGMGSHTEGTLTYASAPSAHAEGIGSRATGYDSHAENYYTKAIGDYSHAEGYETKASSNGQHVQGKCNVEDSSDIYADIIGNGTSSAPKNIEATTWTGDKRLKGDVYVNCNDDSTGGTKLAKITDLSTVATSGSYNDLSNKPTIPTVNNATLTIQKNGTAVGTFTANASSNATANITVPTKLSELTNDSGFTTNTGTVTSVAVKMNGTTKGTVTTNGTIDLGTVITSTSSLMPAMSSLSELSSVSTDDYIPVYSTAGSEQYKAKVKKLAGKDSYRILVHKPLSGDTWLGDSYTENTTITVALSEPIDLSEYTSCKVTYNFHINKRKSTTSGNVVAANMSFKLNNTTTTYEDNIYATTSSSDAQTSSPYCGKQTLYIKDQLSATENVIITTDQYGYMNGTETSNMPEKFNGTKIPGSVSSSHPTLNTCLGRDNKITHVILDLISIKSTEPTYLGYTWFDLEFSRGDLNNA